MSNGTPAEDYGSILQANQAFYDRTRAVFDVEPDRERAEPRLNRHEEHWLALLQGMNKAELDFLRQPVAKRIGGERPCWPVWHWPAELEELYHRTIDHRQQ